MKVWKQVFNKQRKAQELVEFVLALPVILVILMICIEFGIAINVKYTLTEAVKASVRDINQLTNKADADRTNIDSIITTSVQNYLRVHNIPYEYTTKATLSDISGTNLKLLTVLYKYTPQFTLPNVLGSKIIPEEYTFVDSQVINANLLKPNNFSSDLTYIDLMYFWKDTDGLSSILKSDPSDYRNAIAFLVQFDSGIRVFKWDGTDVFPNNIRVNLSTGFLEQKTSSWSSTSVPFNWVLTALGYSQAIYIAPSPLFSPWAFSAMDLKTSYPSSWCTNATCSGDISADDTLIRNSLKIFSPSLGYREGSYDSILPQAGATITNNQKTYTYIEPNKYTFLLTVPNGTKPNSSYPVYNNSWNNGTIINAITPVSISPSLQYLNTNQFSQKVSQ